MFSERLKKSGRYAVTAVFILLTVFCAAVGIADAMVPDSVVLYAGEHPYDGGIPGFVTLDGDMQVGSFGDGEEIPGMSAAVSEYEANARLFGVLPLKTVHISSVERVRLYPGGMPFGVRFYTDGVMVVGVASVSGESGEVTPAQDAGIRIKDVIRTIDGVKVNTVEEVTRLLESCDGRTLSVGVRRGSTDLNVELSPVYSVPDSAWKAGLWIRDSTAGIGTVTYIDPETLSFAGLGHGICDVDTGELMPLLHAEVCDVTLSGIGRGRSGSPGELKGYFGQADTGTLVSNTASGVFGVFGCLPDTIKSEPLEIALGREVKEGRATMLCTVEGSEVREYSVEIEKLRDADSSAKNFIVRVTDPELLALTGGIVQGMSGSPLVQNGKLIGAVTHVLINDPCRGYGIFVENMLDACK